MARNLVEFIRESFANRNLTPLSPVLEEQLAFALQHPTTTVPPAVEDALLLGDLGTDAEAALADLVLGNAGAYLDRGEAEQALAVAILSSLMAMLAGNNLWFARSLARQHACLRELGRSSEALDNRIMSAQAWAAVGDVRNQLNALCGAIEYASETQDARLHDLLQQALEVAQRADDADAILRLQRVIGDTSSGGEP